MFRRPRFASVIDAQLELFRREHRDVIDDVEEHLRAYNDAGRDEAEELYGDYVDAVDAGIDALADLRDHFARTLDDPDRYVDEFNRAVARQLAEFARVSDA
jgi:hypothetical protein